MKKFYYLAFLVTISSMAWATPPSQKLVKSCLKADSVAASIIIEPVRSSDFSQEDQYADGFDASYMFKYGSADMGYAKKKGDEALIYFGKIYRLSKAVPLGENHGIKPKEFEPSLADWSFAKEGRQIFFCVSFNFSGLGQSGEYQNIRGGYLLESKTRNLYFVVRDVRK